VIRDYLWLLEDFGKKALNLNTFSTLSVADGRL
jgi:hypothetical protein